jgi:hypothetical protein
MMTSGTGIATGHPVAGLGLGAVKAVLDHPAIKSYIALALRRAATMGPSAVRLGTAAADWQSRGKPKHDEAETYSPLMARGGTIIDRRPSRAQVLGSLVRHGH